MYECIDFSMHVCWHNLYLIHSERISHHSQPHLNPHHHIFCTPDTATYEPQSIKGNNNIASSWHNYMYIARPITHGLVIVTLSTWHCNYPPPTHTHKCTHMHGCVVSYVWPLLWLSLTSSTIQNIFCFDVVEAHCYVVDIGRTYREQIRSRINNN